MKTAKHHGATVIVIVPPGEHEAARGLGADHVLDSREPDLAAAVALTGGEGVDLVQRSVGWASLNASLTGQTGHRPCRKDGLAAGEKRVEQLGSGLPASGSCDRPENRGADPVCRQMQGE